MPAAIPQVLSQEMFCELCLQKTREIRRKSMESMFSAHREECKYEGTQQLRLLY